MHSIRYRETAALWSLVGYPNFDSELSLPAKLERVAAAGFDSVLSRPLPEVVSRLGDLNLDLWGYIKAETAEHLRSDIDEVVSAGARQITTHLGRHDSEPQKAVDILVEMVAYAKKQGACLTIETHRDTATETPEKFSQIAEGYRVATNRPLPVTFDFSHFAVVKHLMPDEFTHRLLAWPEEIQAARLFHCRPFNGHHCQVPVTREDGSLTPETEQYLVFVKELFNLWQKSPQPPSEIWICPEMGPADAMGYNLSSLPNSWEAAKVLKQALRHAWEQACQKS